MTYHLARVAHWVSNGSVEHYPTPVLRQLHQAPGAEYVVAHLQLLSGGDRFAALVQWFALLGCLAGVSLIAKRLGGGRSAQLLAPLLAATVPMVVLQASSTQNDLVAALWLVVLADAVLRLQVRPPPAHTHSHAAWLSLGGALGLALLTKGTCYLYALPFLLWLGIALIRRRSFHAFKPLPIAVVLVVALNAGPWVRNLRTYGSPLGPGREGGAHYLNQDLSAKSAFSGVVRNLALHYGAVERPFNDRSTASVVAFLKALGIDANDRRTTFKDLEFRIPDLSTHEDWAGNPLHATVFIVSFMVAASLGIARRKSDGQWKEVALYALSCAAAFALFASLVQWQLWHSRLHTPVFILFTPVAGRLLGGIRWRAAHVAAAILLTAAAIPWALSNVSRPLFPMDRFTRNSSVFTLARKDQYFINAGQNRDGYERAARCILDAGCRSIGVLAEDEVWEYPLWAYLSGPGKELRLEHLELPADNPSARLSTHLRDFVPCALATFERTPSATWGLTRKAACSSGIIGVYLR
jgi:hypothetical protein